MEIKIRIFNLNITAHNSDTQEHLDEVERDIYQFNHRFWYKSNLRNIAVLNLLKENYVTYYRPI